jgi:hypothetical protein
MSLPIDHVTIFYLDGTSQTVSLNGKEDSVLIYNPGPAPTGHVAGTVEKGEWKENFEKMKHLDEAWTYDARQRSGSPNEDE